MSVCVCVLCRINNLDGSASGEDTGLAQIIGGGIRAGSKHEREMSIGEKCPVMQKSLVVVFYDDKT